jgi:DNA-binding transcriptional ArsR family regulator
MESMDDSIRLDRKSFEALAGETRVKVMKSLLKRRKTLTELSHELGLSPSTLKEHLEVMGEAELVVLVDEGRKWKYYELTRKGKKIVEPHALKVMIVLGLSIIAAGAALLNLFAAFQAPLPQEMGGGVLAEAAPMETMAAERVDAGEKAVAEENAAYGSGWGHMDAEAEMPSGEGGAGVPFIQVGMAAAALLIFAWALFYAHGEKII